MSMARSGSEMKSYPSTMRPPKAGNTVSEMPESRSATVYFSPDVEYFCHVLKASIMSRFHSYIAWPEEVYEELSEGVA